VRGFCSTDGSTWFAVGTAFFAVEDPVRVGIHAIGAIDRLIYRDAHSQGTAVRFGTFRLWGL
jgi:hypothetical protein